MNYIPENHPFYPTDHCGVLRVNTKDILPKYLALALRVEGEYERFSRSNRASTARIKNLTVQIPSKKIQQDIIDKIEHINTQINAQDGIIEKCNNDIKSRFVEMFGDLYQNTMNWPVMNFNDCASIESNMIHDFAGYEDYPHIGIDSIEKNTGVLTGYRTVQEDGIISGKYLFTPKHIIYSKIRPNLNKVALPEFDGVCSADAYAILPKENVCTRIYLAYVMRSQVFLDYILPLSNRTNLPKVNRKQVEGFHLPVPDIDLQNQFANFVAQVDKSKSVAQKAKNDLLSRQEGIIFEHFK